jgi:hypothetical protein
MGQGMHTIDFARAHHKWLREWASQVFREEGPTLEPRIAAVRQGELVHFKIDKSLHLRGLAQAASVLARAVDDEEFVMALSPGKATLEAREWGAVADIRSRAGARGPVRTLRMLGCRPKANGTTRWQRELPAAMVAHLGDWAEPGYPVEPWLEMQLAMAGVPGAQGGGGSGASGGGTPLILLGR